MVIQEQTDDGGRLLTQSGGTASLATDATLVSEADDPIGVAGEWFRSRTTSWRDWPEDQVLAAKRATGDSVCVIIPTLNEAVNIGSTVDMVLAAQELGLVDDVLVIDSGSTDQTRQIAIARGARVVVHQEVVLEAGSRTGKGEALWKGLRESEGDVIIYLDADIINIAPRYITGLLGPIFDDERVALVKGCFDRPYSDSDESEGGRTTELMARPLLAAHFPELSHVVQPMGGEFSARRAILAEIPFAPDYAVDIGILIDVYLVRGLEAICQVDLGSRIHGHQDIRALGRMSASVLHAILDRVGHRRELDSRLVQFSRDTDGVLQPMISRIETRDRQPTNGSSTDTRRAL